LPGKTKQPFHPGMQHPWKWPVVTPEWLLPVTLVNISAGHWLSCKSGSHNDHWVPSSWTMACIMTTVTGVCSHSVTAVWDHSVLWSVGSDRNFVGVRQQR